MGTRWRHPRDGRRLSSGVFSRILNKNIDNAIRKIFAVLLSIAISLGGTLPTAMASGGGSAQPSPEGNDVNDQSDAVRPGADDTQAEHDAAVRLMIEKLENAPDSDDTDLSSLQNIIPPGPPKRVEEIAARVLTESPAMFEPGYLEGFQASFHDAVSFAGHSEERDAVALDLYSQWLYLEILKAYRLQYLLVNFSHTLVLAVNRSRSEKLQLFDQHMKLDLFAPYGALKEERNKYRAWVAEMTYDNAQWVELRDETLGAIEAAYLTLSLIHSKREFDRARYGENHEQFQKNNEEYKEWEAMVRKSNSALLMDSFVENVENDGEFLEELKPAHQLKEGALAGFVRAFESSMKRKKNWNIHDLVDFLSGEHANDLGIGLAQALEHPRQIRFRKRIALNLPIATEQALENLQQTIEKHREDYLHYDYTLQLQLANTSPATDTDDFKAWLVPVFLETHLHAAIVQDFPYLQGASERLTSFAENVLREKSRNRNKNLTWLATALAFSPVGGSSTGLSRIFVSKWPSTLVRFGFLALGGTVTTKLIYESASSYFRFRNIQRLSRLSLSGMSLTDVSHERTAFYQTLMPALVGGFAGLMSMKVFRGFWKKPPVRLQKVTRTIHPRPDNLLVRGIYRTWKHTPTTARAFKIKMKNTIRLALRDFQAVGALDKIKRLRYLPSLGMDAAALLTQVLTSFPASLVGTMKTWISSVSVNIYKGMIFGTVMTTMGVLVYHYIAAASMKFFVSSFKKLGLQPPTLLLQNSLDNETRIKRDSALMVIGELLGVKRGIVDSLGFITTWKVAKAQPGISADDRRKLDTAIAGRRGIIQDELMLLLAKWYQRIEYRRVYNSVMKESGFGLVATPNMEEPVRMTVMVRIGRDVFKYQSTADYFDQLREREEIPNFDLSDEELENLVKNLKENQVEGV